jgi:hypothetical protein
MKKIILLIFISTSFQTKAQELFVMTEPASNMPSGSIGIRAMNSFMYEKNEKINYHIMPEVMWGINAKWMLHFQGFLSSRMDGYLKGEGGSVYGKYRIYSIDDVHKHFRLAAFGRYSFNNADIHQEEIETMGHNTGYEIGTVATKLINKTALSSSISFEKALNNLNGYKFPTSQGNNATNYTVAFGKLIFPKKYTSLEETNINVMCEFLGQTLNLNGKSYLDIVPSLQFIIQSQARIDIAYRRNMYSSMSRTAPNGFLIKFEYNFFNVTK